MASQTAPTTASEEENTTNIKETIESILVAFILAFIFRAFVVEAFVIPTGSMAPTLLGAHQRFVCQDCGYQFDVNYRAQATLNKSEDPQISPTAFPDTDVYCPNCGYLVLSRTREWPVNYGDRILVLKYIYLLQPPQRWDVVVFKSPDDPADYNYTQNFIKRLVGLPGEQLMVLDGDIYVKSGSDPKWHIQTKPLSVQESLWRIVYDNDYYPQHPKRDGQFDWTQPWKQDAGTGWDLGTDSGTGRTFKFTNAGAAGEIDFHPEANSTSQTLTDYLVYDTTNMSGMMRRPGVNGSDDDQVANPVSDMKLVANYHRTAGEGALRMKLTRHESVDHTFIAQITPDSVSLLHHTNLGDSQIGPTLKLADLGLAGKPLFVEFQNVDYQVTLRLNGKTVLQSSPADYAPNIDWLKKQWDDKARGRWGEAAIEAEKQTCTLEHISLWRDVYYTNRQYNTSLHATPDTPTTLNAGEYFVMGDNSAVSEDARYWNQPIQLTHEGLPNTASGRVPEQFLLGKAVFVYWPAGFRAFKTLAIIPNFGDMRWIH